MWKSLLRLLVIDRLAVSNLFITRGEVIHIIHGDNLPFFLSTFY